MKTPTSLRIITSGLIALALTAIWFISKTQAIPIRINSYSACPPQSNSINVWLDEDNSPTGEAIVRTIPFDSGTRSYNEWIPGEQVWRWVTYDNYLRGVLAAEIGGPEWDTKTLQANAILARTVVYHRCGNKTYGSGYFEQGQRGVPGQTMQEYRYNKIFTFTSAEQTRYQQAVDFGNDPYVTYNNDTFDVQYRDVSREWTNGSAPPHQSIYDPAGLSHSGEPSKTGFMQTNADHWADGNRPSNIAMPPYDAKRLAAHYLSSIGFVGLNPTPPNDYRFNVLRFGGMDDRANNPLILRTGQTYPTSFIVQNTGNNNWSLRCYPFYPWYDTALSFHWYSYPNKQYISPQVPYFEGSRTGLCGPNNTGTLAPGREYPDQSQSNTTSYANVIIQVAPGNYWLRLDVEFRSAFVWGSRLHPQNNQNTTFWPTQDVRVQVIADTVPAPSPGIDSGQTPGQWSNNNTVNLSWAAVNDPMLTHYEVCRDKRNDGQGDNCSNSSSTTYARTLADGIYDFEVTAVTSDGQTSDAATIDNVRIDATPPTANLTPLPVRVQAPDYVLSWSSADIGGSGLQEQQLTYQINSDGNWRTVTAVSSNVNMRSIRFYFPEGQQGDVYEFCLKTRDGAGSWSIPSCNSTTFNPDPELHISPLQLTWYTIYSNTQPNTQTVTIENYGGYVLTWSMTTPFTLTSIGQISGTAPSVVPIVLTHPVGITATYQGYITVTGTTPGTNNSPQVIPVTIYVRERDNTYYFPIIFKQ